MSVSLAERLGPKQGLLAFSLHPGVITTTSLGTHLNWTVDLESLRKFPNYVQLTLLIFTWGTVDRAIGNAEGWAEFKVKMPEQGVATYIYAAFESSLKGKFRFSICAIRIRKLTQRVYQPTTEHTCRIQDWAIPGRTL